jgi:hypothetical protein
MIKRHKGNNSKIPWANGCTAPPNIGTTGRVTAQIPAPAVLVPEKKLDTN